ncbi:MAG: hypothetical protein KQH57_11175 [Actinomycetales bacterium]|nr:hypothetical protein [Actinomycetales bacterium]
MRALPWLPRWARWTALGMLTIGVALIGVGVYLDATGWWVARPFLTNVASSFASALVGIPVSVVLVGGVVETLRSRRLAASTLEGARATCDDLRVIAWWLGKAVEDFPAPRMADQMRADGDRESGPRGPRGTRETVDRLRLPASGQDAWSWPAGEAEGAERVLRRTAHQADVHPGAADWVPAADRVRRAVEALNAPPGGGERFPGPLRANRLGNLTEAVRTLDAALDFTDPRWWL